MVDLTVVVTNFNKGALLVRAVGSLKNQTHQLFSVVVVDDASTDPASHEALDYIKDLEVGRGRPTIIHKARNTGAADAKNMGIAAATTEFVTLLDGDDCLPPSALAKISRAVTAVPDSVAVIAGDYEFVDASGVTEVSLFSISSNGLIDPEKLSKKWILLGASTIRRSTWRELRGFNKNHPRVDDYEFYRKLLTKGWNIAYVPGVVYRWNKSPQGNQATVRGTDTALVFFRTSGFERRFGTKTSLVRKATINAVKLLLWPLTNTVYRYRQSWRNVVAHTNDSN